MHSLTVKRSRDFVIVSLSANAFLHHMVRNIVGELVLVGQGKHEPGRVAQVLAARDRTVAAPTFSAAGLYLSQVQYPQELLEDVPTISVDDLTM